MWYTLVALLSGLLAGLLAGGSFGNLGRQSFRLWALLPAGVALQVVPDLLDSGRDGAFAMLLGSYLCLAVFAGANLRLVGMPVVLVGLAMNVVPIASNRGMPVRGDAITAARLAEPHELATLEFDPKHHLETVDDEWMVLADIIPVRPLREVLSFGDLVMSFGLANVVLRLMKPKPGLRRRADDGPHAAVAAVAPGEAVSQVDLRDRPGSPESLGVPSRT